MKKRYISGDNVSAEVKRIANNIHAISGAHVGIHDFDSNRQISSGSEKQNLCAFCKSRCADFREHCAATDKRNLEITKKSKRSHIYRCHAGLTEVIVPIVYNNEAVGVIFLGQMLLVPDTASSFDDIHASLCSKYPKHFDENCREELYTAYGKTATITKEKLAALIEIATDIMQGTQVNRWFYKNALTSPDRLKKHLSLKNLVKMPLNEISATEAANSLNISYSQLNRLCTKLTGLPYKQYILKIKLDAAVDIFRKNPKKSVSEVAFSVGFDDSYYFSRLFRKKVGVSCSDFKKQIIERG